MVGYDPALIASLPDNSNPPLSNRPETIIGVTLTFLAISVCAVSLRMFVRWRKNLWDWDDLFVMLAGITVTCGSVLTCLMPGDGLGKHYYTLSDADHQNYFRHIWGTNVTYAFSAGCIKTAILIQYVRLFGSQNLLARKLALGLMSLVALWGLTFTFLALFSCHPIAKNWNNDLPGKCVGWGSKDPDVFFAFFTGHSASNTFLDILVLTLPMPFISQLRMSGKSKIGLMSLFAMGGVVVILAGARVVSLCIHRAGTVPIFDVTWAIPTVFIFSILEINVAIWCASIPIFWPLVERLATNKILIVNEIEVRSERRSEHIDLVDKHGKEEAYMNMDGRSESRASILGGKPSPESDMRRTPSRLTRSLSRSHSRQDNLNYYGHRHNKNSSGSSKGALGIKITARPSNDSERNRTLIHQASSRSFASSNKNVNASVDCGGSDHTHARYKDSYNQGWAIPDFDKVTPNTPTYRTSGQRAQVPFDHISAAKE